MFCRLIPLINRYETGIKCKSAYFFLLAAFVLVFIFTKSVRLSWILSCNRA